MTFGTTVVYPITGQNMPLEISEHEASRIYRQSARESDKVVSPTHQATVQLLSAYLFAAQQYKQKEVGGHHQAPTAFPPGRTPYLFCWKLSGPLDRPERHRNSDQQRNSIPGPSSQQRVTIPTEPFRSYVRNRANLIQTTKSLMFAKMLS